MARTVGPFHHRVERRETEVAHIGFGIDFLDRRRKDYRGSALLQQAAVGLQRTRIFSQIVLVVELGRIDEHTDNRGIVLGHTALHERGMPRMQSTHCRYQAYRFTLGTQVGQCLLQVLDSMYYFHYFLS